MALQDARTQVDVRRRERVDGREQLAGPPRGDHAVAVVGDDALAGQDVARVARRPQCGSGVAELEIALRRRRPPGRAVLGRGRPTAEARADDRGDASAILGHGQHSGLDQVIPGGLESGLDRGDELPGDGFEVAEQQ